MLGQVGVKHLHARLAAYIVGVIGRAGWRCGAGRLWFGGWLGFMGRWRCGVGGFAYFGLRIGVRAWHFLKRHLATRLLALVNSGGLRAVHGQSSAA